MMTPDEKQAREELESEYPESIDDVQDTWEALVEERAKTIRLTRENGELRTIIRRDHKDWDGKPCKNVTPCDCPVCKDRKELP